MKTLFGWATPSFDTVAELVELKNLDFDGSSYRPIQLSEARAAVQCSTNKGKNIFVTVDYHANGTFVMFGPEGSYETTGTVPIDSWRFGAFLVSGFKNKIRYTSYVSLGS